MSRPPKILLSRLSAIGDVVRTVPAVKTLRRTFPESEIHWLVEDRCASIIEGLAYVDRLQVVPRRTWERLSLRRRPSVVRAFVGALRAEGYDLYLDFHGIFKSGLYGFLAGIPRRIGYPWALARELNGLFTTEKVSAPAGLVSRYERNLLIPRHFDPGARLERAELPITQEELAFAQRLLAEHGLRRRSFALVYPGSSARGRFKRWLPDRYGDVIDRLHRESALPAMVGWGPGEESLVEEVISRTTCSPIVLPATTPRQLAAVIAHAAVFVGGDTGFLHVASLIGTPVVAILGPSDPLINEPGGFTPHRVVHAGVDCSPCRKRTCERRDCMKAVTSDMVVQAVTELLGEPRSVAPDTSAM